MAAQFPKLQIVWRNPQPVLRHHRWEHIEVGANSALYAIQEFLSTGEHGFWSSICRLQIYFQWGQRSGKELALLRVG